MNTMICHSLLIIVTPQNTIKAQLAAILYINGWRVCKVLHVNRKHMLKHCQWSDMENTDTRSLSWILHGYEISNIQRSIYYRCMFWCLQFSNLSYFIYLYYFFYFILSLTSSSPRLIISGIRHCVSSISDIKNLTIL